MLVFLIICIFCSIRSTADLESFHNHILMYANKRSTFSRPVYEARVLLAALDYNFHRNRPTMKTAEGKEMYVLHLKVFLFTVQVHTLCVLSVVSY